MRGTVRNRWLAIGAAAVGAAIAAHAASTWKRRQHLDRGEIRELRDRWTVVGGCRIYSRVSTAAADPDLLPVVLVHGFGVSSSYFVPTAERLATEFDVYAPDLPGHGKSDTPAEPLDIPALADALVGWMDAVGLTQAMVVANSMGCQIAVDAAVRFPDRFERLVLIGPAGDPVARTVPAHALRLLAGSFFERPSLNGLLLVTYARMGTRTIPELRSLLADPIETKLPRVTMPTMLVRGEHDMVAPQRWLDEAAMLVDAEQVAVIPRWGHAVHYSAAPQLVDAILPFLREGRRARAETSGGLSGEAQRAVPHESRRRSPDAAS